MKKTIISFITVILFCNNIYAQRFGILPVRKDFNLNATIDSGTVRIWYALNATDINNEETYDDLQRLEIGSRISKYYSFFISNNDSLVSDWIKKNPTAQSFKHTMGYRGKSTVGWDECQYSEYFKDFSKNLLTQYIRMPYGIPDQQYSENISTQTWEILEDTLTVAGYLCQKATCRFRGRNYTAWFAMGIPIQNGPWKFGGLPGLILKVYDSDKLYVFECVKIESLKIKYPITLHTHCKSYEKTDRQKFNKLLKRMHDDYYNVAGIISSNKDGSPLSWKKIPYNPLELE